MEASPAYLAPRMKLIQKQVSGPQRVVLNVDPSAAAARWKACGRVEAVGLWDYPFQALSRQVEVEAVEQKLRTEKPDPSQPPSEELRGAAQREFTRMLFRFQVTPQGLRTDQLSPLWKGRLLHLKGTFVGEDSAIACYQQARPSMEELDPKRRLDERLASLKDQLKDIPAEKKAALSSQIQASIQMETALMLQEKVHATYWLGLVSFERGDYPSAIDYFAKHILATYPPGPWTRGTNYNLGRSLEAAGRYEDAVQQYRATQAGDAGQGLRARWLARAAGLEPPAKGK
jgi:tetratricopeptide (TPR) repeat protein